MQSKENSLIKCFESRVTFKIGSIMTNEKVRENIRLGRPDIAFLAMNIVPKKVELLIRFFEPFWISRVFHFSLRTFAKVEAHPGPLGTSDETCTQSKFDISGSNETMQNALASIV